MKARSHFDAKCSWPHVRPEGAKGAAGSISTGTHIIVRKSLPDYSGLSLDAYSRSLRDCLNEMRCPAFQNCIRAVSRSGEPWMGRVASVYRWEVSAPRCRE